MKTVLVRALSKLGAASRTDARALVVAGRVSVNGRTVKLPLHPIVLNRDRITVDGHSIARATPRTIAFHKPRGTITTRRDPEGRPTVFDVLGDVADGLVAVGRLDRASTGLLLLTNDTDLANALTDPAARVSRRYVVTVRGRVLPETARRLEAGVEMPGARGARETMRAELALIRKASGRETHLLVSLTEGRNREIRRLFESVGHEVTRVHRIAFGPIELGDLQPGRWREVTESLARVSGASARPPATMDTRWRRRARSGPNDSGAGGGSARGE